MTSPELGATRTTPGLRIASILCWLCGIILALGSGAVLVPALAMAGFGPSAMIGLGMVLIGIAYCVAGYLLFKARFSGAVLALVLVVVMSLLQFVASLFGSILTLIIAGVMSFLHLGMSAQGGYAALALNLAIAILVILNWKHLHRPRPVPTL